MPAHKHDTPDTFPDVKAKVATFTLHDGTCWVLAEDYRALETALAEAQRITQEFSEGLRISTEEGMRVKATLVEAEAQVAALRETAEAFLKLSYAWEQAGVFGRDLGEEFIERINDAHRKLLTAISTTSAVATARDNRLRVEGMEIAENAAMDQQGRRMMGTGQRNSDYDIGISDAAAAIRAEAAKLRGEG